MAHDANPNSVATEARKSAQPHVRTLAVTTAGTIPLAMQTAIEQGKLKKGSLVLLASVGAGFTVGATLLRWAF